MRLSMKRNKGNILIFLGLLCIIAALFIAFYNVYDGERAEKVAREIVSQLKVQIPEEPEITISTVIPEREMPTIELDGYSYIGTLDVPDLELSLPIMEDWNDTMLKISPCRYAGSIYQDNMVIAGHNYRGHFSRLKSLPLESEIIFTDVEGNAYFYTIAWIEVLEPDQVEEMISRSDEESDWDLTLFTCTVGGGSRYTIRCIRND